MQEETYGYTAQSRVGQADFTYRPLLDVKIGSDSKSRTFKALVDSGTEVTVMDQRIADLLEIHAAGKERASLLGLEAWREGFIAPVSIQIDRFEEIFTFRVLFIEDLHKNFDIILGQQDFFRSFHVRFERSMKRFSLERAPAPEEE